MAAVDGTVLVRGENTDQPGRAPFTSCKPGRVQLQVRFFPAYGLGWLAGRMFWLMWKMLSGS